METQTIVILLLGIGVLIALIFLIGKMTAQFGLECTAQLRWNMHSRTHLILQQKKLP